MTGSRDWTDGDAIRGWFGKFPRGTTIVEGCARGADRLAEYYAPSYGFTVEHHPADWSLGKRAGLMRSLEMLDYPIPDLVLAFWDGKSRGTGFTVTAARKRGIPVEVIKPDNGRDANQ